MIQPVRTTLDIAEDVLRELKGLARKSDRPVTEVANEVLRRGLAAMRGAPKKSRPYKEGPVDMGEPRVDLTKALALAAEIEDEEHIRKFQLRK
jgi:hypothetical protein